MKLQEALQKIRASGLNDAQIAKILSKKIKTPPQTVQRLRVGKHGGSSKYERTVAILELAKKVKVDSE